MPLPPTANCDRLPVYQVPPERAARHGGRVDGVRAVQHLLVEPSAYTGVDVKVIITPPCIFCMENHQ